MLQMNFKTILIAVSTTLGCVYGLQGATASSAPAAYPGDITSEMRVNNSQMTASINSLLEADAANRLADDAEDMLDALWKDWGFPEINFRFQFDLVRTLRWYPSYAGSRPEQVAVADAIVDGLLEFYEAMPKMAPVGADIELAAMYYIELASAIAAANVYINNSAAQRAVMEIVALHGQAHPLGVSVTMLDYLVRPNDKTVVVDYYMGIVTHYDSNVSACMCIHTPQQVVAPNNPITRYKKCIQDCHATCNQLDSGFLAMLCRAGCHALCIPLSIPGPIFEF